jgi:putative membrane protein
MNPPTPSSLSTVLDAVGSGLPLLLAHLLTCLALLVIGVFIYVQVTPFRERELIDQGNAAAGTVLGGTVLALAIPQAALLATSGRLLDIVVWGAVALVIQLITLAAVSAVLRGLAGKIKDNNVAAAIALAATQVAVALLTASVMVPN